jgi:hypothetical protein
MSAMWPMLSFKAVSDQVLTALAPDGVTRAYLDDLGSDALRACWSGSLRRIAWCIPSAPAA